MFNLGKSFVFLGLILFSVASNADSKILVKDITTYQEAAVEACTGSSIGASCTITFEGGEVSIGVCIEVPGPAGAYLSCKIDPSKIPSCKNNAVGTPGSAMMFAVLALGLFIWRRRQVI